MKRKKLWRIVVPLAAVLLAGVVTGSDPQVLADVLVQAVDVLAPVADVAPE